MDIPQGISLGGAALLVAYYFWPTLKGLLPSIGGGGSSTDDPRIAAAELLVQAQVITTEASMAEATAAIQVAQRAIWEAST